jgi:hypothetical protein
MPKVDAGSYYVNKNSIHSQNEWQYIVGDRHSILDLFQFDVSFDHNRKYVQFFTIYHIFAHHHPIMFNFENFKALFQMLKVKNVS